MARGVGAGCLQRPAAPPRINLSTSLPVVVPVNEPELGKLGLIVGRSSVLASSFLDAAGSENLKVVSHDEIDKPDLFDGVDIVVNFAIHPDYSSQPYSPAIDFDRRLGAAIGDRDVHYVMLSSRKVYASEVKWDAVETDPAEGMGVYGRNKAMTEKHLTEVLGARLTILRLGNVIGYELVEGRNRFMALLLEGLKREGRITYDMSPFSRRDFVTDAFFAAILKQVVQRRSPGIYNVSSGRRLETGWIAMWVMEGFGAGELTVKSHRIVDEFVLDVRKQTHTFGLSLTREDLHNHCVMIGRRLAHE